MLKKILIAVVALIVVLCIVIALQPSSFRVERSRTMEVPAAVVYAIASDFAKFGAWSPWEKLDPDMKRELTGAPGTVGATYSWKGNDQVGEGRMTLIEATPNEKLVYTLEFLAPWQSTNQTELLFEASGDQTRVTWGMTGTNNFMMKAFGLFMNMDEMIGKSFDEGLEGLERVARAELAQRDADGAGADGAEGNDHEMPDHEDAEDEDAE